MKSVFLILCTLHDISILLKINTYVSQNASGQITALNMSPLDNDISSGGISDKQLATSVVYHEISACTCRVHNILTFH